MRTLVTVITMLSLLGACKARQDAGLSATELDNRRAESRLIADAIARMSPSCDVDRSFANTRGDLGDTSAYLLSYPDDKGLALDVMRFFSHNKMAKACERFPLVDPKKGRAGVIYEYRLSVDMVLEEEKGEKSIAHLRWRLDSLRAPLAIRALLAMATAPLSEFNKKSFLEISEFALIEGGVPFIGTPIGLTPLFLPVVDNEGGGELPTIEDTPASPFAPQVSAHPFAKHSYAPKKGNMMLLAHNLKYSSPNKQAGSDTRKLLMTKFAFNHFDDVRKENLWKDPLTRPVMIGHCEAGCDSFTKIKEMFFDFENYGSPKPIVRFTNIKVSRGEHPLQSAKRFFPNIPSAHKLEGY